MGAVASSALEAGGDVHGITPSAFLSKGEKGDELVPGAVGGKMFNLEGEKSKVTVVKGMHEVRVCSLVCCTCAVGRGREERKKKREMTRSQSQSGA